MTNNITINIDMTEVDVLMEKLQKLKDMTSKISEHTKPMSGVLREDGETDQWRISDCPEGEWVIVRVMDMSKFTEVDPIIAKYWNGSDMTLTWISQEGRILGTPEYPLLATGWRPITDEEKVDRLGWQIGLPEKDGLYVAVTKGQAFRGDYHVFGAGAFKYRASEKIWLRRDESSIGDVEIICWMPFPLELADLYL